MTRSRVVRLPIDKQEKLMATDSDAPVDLYVAA
jgi:hypothetical protein